MRYHRWPLPGSLSKNHNLLRGVLCLSAFLASGHAVQLRAADIRLDQSIRQIRMGTLVVEAAPGAEVRVEQVRHEFWFGAALASQVFGGRMRAEEREQYLSVFLTNFNAAVTENALKWHAMESRPGNVDYAVVDAIVTWTDRH